MRLVNQFNSQITTLMPQTQVEAGDYQLQEPTNGLAAGNYVLVADFRRIVKSLNNPNKTDLMRLRVSDLPNGMYIGQVQFSQQPPLIFKFVKQ